MDTAAWLVPESWCLGSCHRPEPQPKLGPEVLQSQGEAKGLAQSLVRLRRRSTSWVGLGELFKIQGSSAGGQ